MKKHIISALIVLTAIPLTHAAFNLVDDFESYTTGNAEASTGSNAFTNNGGSWSAVGGSTASVAEAGISILNDSGNKVLAVGGTNLGAKLNAIADIANTSTAATVFFQVKNLDATPNATFGLSDTTSTSLTTSSIFNDFELQAGINETSGTDILNYRNGGTTSVSSFGVPQATWVNIWLVVNNNANTWDLYASTGTDSPTSIASSIGFRNGAATNILQSLLIASATHDVSGLYLDNIYIDIDSSNLDNPAAIPEPSIYAVLVGLTTLAVTSLRRRRQCV